MKNKEIISLITGPFTDYIQGNSVNFVGNWYEQATEDDMFSMHRITTSHAVDFFNFIIKPEYKRITGNDCPLKIMSYSAAIPQKRGYKVAESSEDVYDWGKEYILSVKRATTTDGIIPAYPLNELIQPTNEEDDFASFTINTKHKSFEKEIAALTVNGKYFILAFCSMRGWYFRAINARWEDYDQCLAEACKLGIIKVL